jgi:hypothetical protein
MLVRIASELEATGAVRFSMEPSSGFSKAILSHKRKEPKCGLTQEDYLTRSSGALKQSLRLHGVKNDNTISLCQVR